MWKVFFMFYISCYYCWGQPTVLRLWLIAVCMDAVLNSKNVASESKRALIRFFLVCRHRLWLAGFADSLNNLTLWRGRRQCRCIYYNDDAKLVLSFFCLFSSTKFKMFSFWNEYTYSFKEMLQQHIHSGTQIQKNFKHLIPILPSLIVVLCATATNRVHNNAARGLRTGI